MLPASPCPAASPGSAAAAARRLEIERRSLSPRRLSCLVFSADSWRIFLRLRGGPASASAGPWPCAGSPGTSLLCPPVTDLLCRDSQEGLLWEHRGRPGGAGGPGPCCLGGRGSWHCRRVHQHYGGSGVRRDPLCCRGGLLTMWPGTAALGTSDYLDAAFLELWLAHSKAHLCPSLRGLCTGLSWGRLRLLVPHTSTVFLRSFSGLCS